MIPKNLFVSYDCLNFPTLETYNQFHNILRLFDVLTNFPFTTSERCASITYKHGMYELPRELTNDLRLKILVNYEISGKCLNLIERMIA